MVLTRDGKGNGDKETESKYKSVLQSVFRSGTSLIRTLVSEHRSIDYFDISGATNFANSKYDAANDGVAPNGQLHGKVTPAVYTPFVSLIDSDQLSRFGLHNGT